MNESLTKYIIYSALSDTSIVFWRIDTDLQSTITIFYYCVPSMSFRFFFLNMEPFVNIDEYPILVPLSLLLSHSSSPFLLLYSNIPMDLLLGCLPSPGSPPFLNGESQPCSCLVSLGLTRSSDAAMWDVWSMQDVLPSCGCRHRHRVKGWFLVSLSSSETN